MYKYNKPGYQKKIFLAKSNKFSCLKAKFKKKQAHL